MQRYLVSARGEEPTTVLASNWLSALGEGLDRLGLVSTLDRLACEVLPNGTVVARDVRTGMGFIVRPAGTERTPAESEDLPTMPELSSKLPTTTAQAASTRAAEAVREWATSDVLTTIEDDSEELEVEPEDPAEVLRAHLFDTLVGSIRHSPSPAAAWQRALEIAQELVGADAGGAIALEVEGLRFVGARGPMADQLLGVVLPEGTGVAGFCCRRRVSLVVQDAYRDARFYRDLDEETGYHTRQVVCVPVATSARVHGCLELLNPPEGRSFGRGDIEVLEAVCSSLCRRLVELG